MIDLVKLWASKKQDTTNKLEIYTMNHIGMIFEMCDVFQTEEESIWRQVLKMRDLGAYHVKVKNRDINMRCEERCSGILMFKARSKSLEKTGITRDRDPNTPTTSLVENCPFMPHTTRQEFNK